MRKLTLLLCCTILSIVISAQTTTVQTDNCINCESSINPSAAFEIRTTTQGILIPKMSATEKEAIQDPVKGLLVFDTSNDSFYFFNGTHWVSLVNRDGLPGPRGPQGVAGVQGIQGVPGPRGVQGVQGNPGPRGPKGNSGQQGATGLQGLTGPRGYTGPKGNTGQRGATGLQGLPGPRGYTGSKGNTGPKGPKGNTGQRGATGLQGLPGPRGYTGPKGSAGTRGPKGNTGQRGATGLQGMIGSRGPIGQTGKRGQRGPQGVVGPKGDRGYRGNKGDRGLRGYPGYRGATGARGPQGIPGNQGIRGPKGDRGIQGPAGPCCSSLLEDELEGIALLRTAFEEQQLFIDNQMEEIASLRHKLLTLEVMVDKLTLVASSNTKNKIPNREVPVGEPQEQEVTSYTLVLKDDILLKQNYPNPFKSNTSIEYYIPVGSQEASLRITTIDGKNLGSLIIKETGAGKVDIEVEDESYLSGILIYSLYVDGELYESKKMTVTR